MTAPTMPEPVTTQPASPANQHAAILEWLDRWRAQNHGAAAGLLDFDGVPTLDTLLVPLYLAALQALRKGPSPQSGVVPAIYRQARHWGYRAKRALAERRAARGSAPAGPAEILLWPREVTHTAILTPVAAALACQGASCRVLACQAKTFEGLKRRVPEVVFTGAAWPQAIREARRKGAQRARALASLHDWNPPEPRITGGERLGAIARQAVLHALPQVAEAAANARMAIERLRPKVLVVGNDLTMEGRTACRVAALRGVPTVTFMHGSITGDVLQSRHVADRLLVFGDIHRHEMVARGIASERIVVVGAPHLDQRPSQSGQTHPALQQRLGLRPGEPWILVATSGPGHRISHAHHQQVIQNLAALARRLPSLPVVIKLHRKDRLEYYQSAFHAAEPGRLHVVADNADGYPRNILDWLQGASVVLTGASTVALEAMLMEVPVVTMDFCSEIHEVDFIEAGATLHVTSADALDAAVRDLLSGGAPPELQVRVRAHLERCYFSLDGRSAERGGETIRGIAAHGLVEATSTISPR